MRKKIILFSLCSVLLTGLAFAADVPLCEIPNWGVAHEGISSQFSVFLDSRRYNASDYGNISYPEGGVKFELMLWDDVTGNTTISKVEYTNTTNGDSHVISPSIYVYPSGSVSTEYSIWLGTTTNLLGNWRLTVTAGNTDYYYDFPVTQAMLQSQTKPPLSAVTVKKTDRKTVKKGVVTHNITYTVTGTTSSFNGYKVRLTIFENNGIDFLFRSSNQYPTGKTVTFTVPGCLTGSSGQDCDLSNNAARLEVKNADSSSPWYSYTSTCSTANAPARTLVNFKFPK